MADTGCGKTQKFVNAVLNVEEDREEPDNPE